MKKPANQVEPCFSIYFLHFHSRAKQKQRSICYCSKPGRNERSIERVEPLLAKLVLAFRSAFSIHVPASSLARLEWGATFYAPLSLGSALPVIPINLFANANFSFFWQSNEFSQSACLLRRMRDPIVEWTHWCLIKRSDLETTPLAWNRARVSSRLCERKHSQLVS